MRSIMKRIEWVHCPVCGSKTRLQIRADTELKNFPLYCPKCKQESLINAKDLQVTVINSIEENILERLSGSDFDSDTMLITDNKLLGTVVK